MSNYYFGMNYLKFLESDSEFFNNSILLKKKWGGIVVLVNLILFVMKVFVFNKPENHRKKNSSCWNYCLRCMNAWWKCENIVEINKHFINFQFLLSTNGTQPSELLCKVRQSKMHICNWSSKNHKSWTIDRTSHSWYS